MVFEEVEGGKLRHPTRHVSINMPRRALRT
jgi:hypothetical protein